MTLAIRMATVTTFVKLSTFAQLTGPYALWVAISLQTVLRVQHRKLVKPGDVEMDL